MHDNKNFFSSLKSFRLLSTQCLNVYYILYNYIKLAIVILIKSSKMCTYFNSYRSSKIIKYIFFYTKIDKKDTLPYAKICKKDTLFYTQIGNKYTFLYTKSVKNIPFHVPKIGENLFSKHKLDNNCNLYTNQCLYQK